MAEPAAAERMLNRDFVLLWQGQLVSQIGSQAFAVATLYWAMRATDSASLVGTLMMLSMLPAVLLSPFAGAVADRVSRRTILIVADVVSGVAILTAAALFHTRAGDTSLLFATLCAAVVVGGVANAFFQPAIAAAVPDVVPAAKVGGANAMLQMSSQGTMVVGQAAGGVLFALVGAPALLLIDGLTYLFSAGSEALIRIPQKLPAPRSAGESAWRSYRRDLAGGFGFVRSMPGMLPFLFLAGALNFLLMPVLVMLPFYVERVLGKGPAWYGFLLAGLGVGSLVGMLLAGTVPTHGPGRSRTLIAALVGVAAAFAVLGQVTAPALALAIMAAIGVLIGLFNIVVVTLFQVATPTELRGRIMGLLMTLTSAAAPLGLGLGGILGDLTDKNVPAINAVCGGLTLLLVLALGTRPAVQSFLAREARPADPT